MDFQSPGISYALLVIPSLFALVVVGQGMAKLTKHEADGGIVLGFGIALLVLIAAAYFLFIR